MRIEFTPILTEAGAVWMGGSPGPYHSLLVIQLDASLVSSEL